MLNVVPKACLMVKYYYFVNLESILICIEFMGSDKGGDGGSHILTHSHTLSLRIRLGRRMEKWEDRKWGDNGKVGG